LGLLRRSDDGLDVAAQIVVPDAVPAMADDEHQPRPTIVDGEGVQPADVADERVPMHGSVGVSSLGSDREARLNEFGVGGVVHVKDGGLAPVTGDRSGERMVAWVVAQGAHGPHQDVGRPEVIVPALSAGEQHLQPAFGQNLMAHVTDIGPHPQHGPERVVHRTVGEPEEVLLLRNLPVEQDALLGAELGRVAPQRGLEAIGDDGPHVRHGVSWPSACGWLATPAPASRASL